MAQQQSSTTLSGLLPSLYPDHLYLSLCLSASLSMPVSWCEYAFHGGGQIRGMGFSIRRYHHCTLRSR